jgi:hypothetical protein
MNDPNFQTSRELLVFYRKAFITNVEPSRVETILLSSRSLYPHDSRRLANKRGVNA